MYFKVQSFTLLNVQFDVIDLGLVEYCVSICSRYRLELYCITGIFTGILFSLFSRSP